MNDVKSWVHIFSDSYGSVVDIRTRNDLYAGEVSKNKSTISEHLILNQSCLMKIHAKRAGSFGGWLKAALYCVV